MEQLPTHTRVIIIGGGVVGCSILYHLVKKGWKDCILLERRELSCGSSWHAAGQFHIINSNANLSKLQLQTLKFYPQLEKESGQDIGLHRTGGIYFASTKERLDYLKQERGKNHHINPDMVFIDLEEAKRMHPLIDKNCFVGALYDPLDGHIDPASVVQAYAKAAKKLGGQIFQHTMVNNTTQHSNGQWCVNTEKGDIHAEFIINAGGLWAREVGHMVGIELPIMAMEHHYLVTERIESIARLKHELPSIVDFDGNAYGRQEGQGMLLGTYEKNGTAWSIDQTPWDFGHELLPNQLERIAERLDQVFLHFPELATAGIKKVVNGPFTFAPDGNPLIGPIPSLRNYWVACGVMAGYSQGAGIGDVISDWMINGEPGMDIFAMDVTRFGPYATKHYALNKVIENFGRRFQITYPNEELPAMRPWKTTALYDRLKSAGAVFGSSFGLEHALWFTPNQPNTIETPCFRRSNAFPYVDEEVKAVRENVGLIEIANFAKYEISGKNAFSFLDTLLAGRLPSVGQVALTPMVTMEGRLLGDLSVATLADNTFLIVGSSLAQEAHMRWFKMHMPKEVTLINRTNHWHGIAIAGPQSRELLSRLVKEDISAQAFPFMHVKHIEIGGIPSIVSRISFTGELGYEIYCLAEYQLALYDMLTKASRINTDLKLRLFGSRALMSMRLEKNFGAWAMDFREDFTPWEAKLNQFIDYNKKTSFIGKDALYQQRENKAKQHRVTFAIESTEVDVCGDEPIFCNNDYIGFVTSGGYGHYVNTSLAMGYIDADADNKNHDFSIDILGTRYPAKILPLPLYDPQGKKMRKD